MIGVFDSGFGGLTILKSFLAVLPEHSFVYLGDNARAPYGDKSPEVIYEYTCQAVDFLFQQGCELVIVACNTASAEALRRIQQEFLPKNYPDKRVLGVIIPVAEEASSFRRPIGVIATRATIDSGAYQRELNKFSEENIMIIARACPLLVPLVEEGVIGCPETNRILKRYLRPLKIARVKTLILGCTHYPLLLKDIKRIMGKQVEIINPPLIVARKLKEYLTKHPEIDKKIAKDGQKKFFTTDSEDKFLKVGKKFLLIDNFEITKIDFNNIKSV